MQNLLSKKYQPKSLYELSKLKVRETYRYDWKHVKDSLPKTVYVELLEDWLKCEEELPESDDDYERVINYFSNKSINWRELTDEEFVYVMRHPNEVPEFAYEKNHIHLNYYIYRSVNNPNCERRLCEACFSYLSKFYKYYSGNLWQEQGIMFDHVKDHCIVEGDELLEEFVWKAKNWCDNCPTAALFNIIDEEDCRFFYNLHTRKRTFNCDSDYDTDDDSDVEYCFRRPVRGHFIDNTLYQFLKRNKNFNN